MIKNFLKGMAFGATIGTISGLLFAPRSGNKTRQKLIAELEEATELTVELNNSLNNFKRSIYETKQTASTLLPAFQEAVKKDIENYKFQAEPRIAQIQKQVEKLSNELPQDIQ